MKTLLKWAVLFFALSHSAWANDAISPWYTQGADKKVQLNVELFLSSTCPHCHKADAFFRNIVAKSPDFKIQRNVINEDKNALLRFNQLLQEQHLDDFAVPSIYFCDSRWLGYADDATTGKDLLRALNYCKTRIEKDGVLKESTVKTLRQWANANKFDSGMIENPSAMNYIVTMALTDAFSSCAFFGFACFLAFLVLEANREKQVLMSVLFIFAVALSHFFQQTFTSAFYILLPWLRIPSILLGLLTLYFVRQQAKNEPKNNLGYWVACLLGLLVTGYQQTCEMNWSYIFEQWLHNQTFSEWQLVFYAGFYQVLYVLPLILMLMIYVSLAKMKRIAACRPRCAIMGLVFLAGVALLLIIYPAALASLYVSLAFILLAIVIGFFINLA